MRRNWSSTITLFGLMGMTIAWLASPARGVVVGDADLDGDVDLKDLAALQSCFGGTNQPIPASCTTANSWSIDINGDGSVDEIDFDAIAACVSGADVAASATCDLPQFNVIISGPASVEDGHSAVLTAITTNGTGPASFDWEVLLGQAAFENSLVANPTVWINGTQNILVKVTAVENNGPPVGNRFATDTFIINVDPHPPLTFEVFAGSNRGFDVNQASTIDLFGAYFDPDACPEIAILWEWQLVATPPGGGGWFDKPHRLGTPSEPVQFTPDFPTANGEYTFALSATSSCSGLSDSDTLVVDVTGGGAGAIFTLTLGTDLLVGTDNPDSYIAPANTLGDADVLDGKGGVDTLNALLLGVDLTAGTETPTLVDIEELVIDSRGSANLFELQGTQPHLVYLIGNADFEWFDFDGSQGTTINLNAFEDMLTLDFDDAGLDGDDDSLNLIFTNVGVDSANVVLEEGDAEELEELGLTSTGGANKVNLDVGGDVVIGDVTIDGGSDLTIEAESDDLTGLVVDAFSLGAMFTVRSDQDGGDALDLTDYTGLDMVDVFDGGGSDPDITIQEGAGVLFTETYDDPTITVSGAGAAGQNSNNQTIHLAGDADIDLDELTIDNVENITIDSGTINETDPDSRSNSIADLYADDLDVLTITGSTDLSFGNSLGKTGPVKSIVATSFSGDLAVTFDSQGDNVVIASGSGDDDLGGSDASDVIEGGDGDDTIEGNVGDDLLSGGTGSDTFVFEATAAANGGDTITDFDLIDASNVEMFATDDFPTATLSDESTGDQPVFDNNLFIVLDSNGSTNTPSDVALLFGGGKPFAAPSGNENIVLEIRDTRDNGDTAIWYVDNDSISTIGAAECTNVAILVDFNGPDCAVDGDCDDGLFCSGVEMCDPITLECLAGFPPCDAINELCDEPNDLCVACPDDGLFCTGSRFLNAGSCGFTGDPCGQGETCNDLTDTCDPIPGGMFDLTPGTDILVGTINADTFSAVLGTFGANDQLDGGSGPDILNVDFVGDLSLPTETPTLTSIETIDLQLNVLSLCLTPVHKFGIC